MRSATQQALRGATELNLSPREFALLHLFLTHPATVLNRAQILETVWARNQDMAPNLVDQYVLFLRRKIDRPFGMHNSRPSGGAGYRLREHPTPVTGPGYPPQHTNRADRRAVTAAEAIPPLADSYLARRKDSEGLHPC